MLDTDNLEVNGFQCLQMKRIQSDQKKGTTMDPKCIHIQIYPKNDQSNHSSDIGNTTPLAKTNVIQQMVALGLLNALDQLDHNTSDTLVGDQS